MEVVNISLYKFSQDYTVNAGVGEVIEDQNTVIYYFY